MNARGVLLVRRRNKDVKALKTHIYMLWAVTFLILLSLVFIRGSEIVEFSRNSEKVLVQ